MITKGIVKLKTMHASCICRGPVEGSVKKVVSFSGFLVSQVYQPVWLCRSEIKKCDLNVLLAWNPFTADFVKEFKNDKYCTSINEELKLKSYSVKIKTRRSFRVKALFTNWA